MLKIAISTIAAITITASSCFASDWKLIEDNYTAKEGDTVTSIAHMFIVKNTYGKRELHEFVSGIYELNDFLSQRKLKEGDNLRINYWIKNNKN